MTLTDTVLRRCLEGGGDDVVLTLDPAFQGLPDTAHGGSVLALFDALAGRAAARTVHGHYRRRVPLGAPLRLRLARAAGALECRLADDTGLLVDGGVTAAAAPDAREAAAPPAAGTPLPVSAGCFACGVDNPLGLRARLVADDAGVGGEWRAGAAFHGEDGLLPPVALTTLLDEAAFWLGALATGESGMTTGLRVILHRAIAADAVITVSGARAAARPRADDARYWDTTVAARDGTGAVVASAAITFVAVRGAARRLVNGMLRMNAPDVVRRVFPAYAR